MGWEGSHTFGLHPQTVVAALAGQRTPLAQLFPTPESCQRHMTNIQQIDSTSVQAWRPPDAAKTMRRYRMTMAGRVC